MAQNSSAERWATPSLSGVCQMGSPGLPPLSLACWCDHSTQRLKSSIHKSLGPREDFSRNSGDIHLAPGPERSRILWTVLFLAAHSS